MTEYKQLTAGGMILGSQRSDGFIDIGVYTLQDLQMECLQLVCVNNANVSSNRHQLILPPTNPRPTGPISESDFFTWEALVCGPKDTPFVSEPLVSGDQKAATPRFLALTQISLAPWTFLRKVVCLQQNLLLYVSWFAISRFQRTCAENSVHMPSPPSCLRL